MADLGESTDQYTTTHANDLIGKRKVQDKVYYPMFVSLHPQKTNLNDDKLFGVNVPDARSEPRTNQSLAISILYLKIIPILMTNIAYFGHPEALQRNVMVAHIHNVL